MGANAYVREKRKEIKERVTNTAQKRKERKENDNFTCARKQGKGEKRKATVMLWGTMRLLMGSNITEDVVMWLSQQDAGCTKSGNIH